MAEAVFVSPHYDDVALSCGGTVARLARSGSPLIVTVFGEGPANETVSDFARSMLEQWGLSAENVIERRRAEDACAAAALGESVRTRWLSYQDAIYRNPRIGSDETLFAEADVVDPSLIQDIADDLDRLEGSEYFLPLAAGHHVDHQIVLRAGELLARAGRVVWLYSDMPYAILNQAGYRERAVAVADNERREAWLDLADFERRWAAIECYVSQLGVIFKEVEDPRRQFEEFHARGPHGELVEWFWRLEPV